MLIHRNAGKTAKLKGYRVKVNFQPLKESDKNMKRKAITEVVLDSFKPEK